MTIRNKNHHQQNKTITSGHSSGSDRTHRSLGHVREHSSIEALAAVVEMNDPYAA